MVPARADCTGEVVALLGTACASVGVWIRHKLLGIEVRLVARLIIRSLKQTVGLRLHHSLLSRDTLIRCIADLLVPGGRLVGVLALRPLGNVLQEVALDFHSSTVRAVVGDLDESVQVIIRCGRVVLTTSARGTIDLILIVHTAVLGRNRQSKGVATL